MGRRQIRIGISAIAMMVAISAFGTGSARAAVVAFEKLPDANNHGDFVVGPGKQELKLAPGQSQTVDITIANRMGVDKTFTIDEQDFEGSSNLAQATMLLGNDRGPYSLKDDIHSATTTITIPNGYRARIPVTVTVPQDAQPGGLYGSLVVGTVSSPSQTDALQGSVPAAAIISQIGALFFVTIPGPVNVSGHTAGFMLSSNKSVLWDSQPVRFDILYKNDGNMYVDPYGTISVTNMFGSNIGSLNVDAWFAMPQSLRFREVIWTPPFLFGRYVAHASINRGFGSTTDEEDLVFWVIPWKIILLAFVGLVIVIWLIRWIFSHVSISTKRKS